MSYGYNQIVNRNGQVLRPGGRPLQGGERLILTKEYQTDANAREYARVYAYMAPIRDALLYNFENTPKKEWQELTQVLKVNKIKTTPAQGIGPRSVLSIEQVYDYIKRRPREGARSCVSWRKLSWNSSVWPLAQSSPRLEEARRWPNIARSTANPWAAD